MFVFLPYQVMSHVRLETEDGMCYAFSTLLGGLIYYNAETTAAAKSTSGVIELVKAILKRNKKRKLQKSMLSHLRVLDNNFFQQEVCLKNSLSSLGLSRHQDNCCYAAAELPWWENTEDIAFHLYTIKQIPELLA